jgi:hypothetical protein
MEPTPDGETVYRYMGHSSTPSPALKWPIVVSELAGLAGVRNQPYPKEGIVYVGYSGVRLRWQFRMMSESSSGVLRNLGNEMV